MKRQNDEPIKLSIIEELPPPAEIRERLRKAQVEASLLRSALKLSERAERIRQQKKGASDGR